MSDKNHEIVGSATPVDVLGKVDTAAALSSELDSATEALRESTQPYVFDGDRELVDHRGGEPIERTFIGGDEDPRDAAISEKVESEECVFEGRIFNVNRLHVRLPDGNEGIRDVVRHPGAVAVVALTDEGKICLVRQYRTSLGRVTVEIPAGKLEPGEDPLYCARRELVEETGMRAHKMAFLTSIATSDGFTDELIHIYMATGLTFVESSPDDDEFINVDLVDLPELVDAVLDGRVEDAKTVVGALICDAVAHRLNPQG